MISEVRVCPTCALVSPLYEVFCPACDTQLPLPDGWRLGATAHRDAVATIPGALPFLLALLVVTLAAMGLRRCEVEPLEDEHALPAFSRWLVKEPATYPMIAAPDRCASGWAPKLDGVLPAMEPNS
jgi:hypothetical protein